MRAIISGIAANAPRGGALESESIREFLWPPPPLPLHFPGCGYRAASGWKRFFTQPLHAASSRSLVWQQNENVVFEQSRNVVLTAPSFGDAGRTTTDDPSR